MIKKIKATYAKIEGDLVIVEKRAHRALRTFSCCLFGIVLFIALSIIFFIGINTHSIIWIAFVSALLGFFTSPDKKIYQIPKKDLIVIKESPRTHHVTVVFNDEKHKIEGLGAS